MGHQEQHLELFLLHIFVVYVFVKGWFLMFYSKQQCIRRPSVVRL